MGLKNDIRMGIKVSHIWNGHRTGHSGGREVEQGSFHLGIPKGKGFPTLSSNL